jgi:hypothetical protein
MTSTSENPAASSYTNSVPGAAPAGSGHYMLTLCRLAAPVIIRPPESPHLKPFTFFTSRAPQPDGSERLYLHMGYFQTLRDAEVWVQIVRRRYPHAIATLASGAFLRAPDSPAAASPLDDASLTDTQVLKILEKRRAPFQDDAAERDCEPIALLRPEDTGTRQALRDAVAQGAPVYFALQLQWSAEPIDLAHVPAVAIFKAYTLYATENRRDGRSRYFLRLGFFADPISAKQVAAAVLANFAAAAVVPVTELEVTRVRDAARDGFAIPYLAYQGADLQSERSDTPPPAAKPAGDPSRRAARRAPTLEQTLKQLARREMLTDPDTLNESGVRHLKLEVLTRRTTRRT